MGSGHRGAAKERISGIRGVITGTDARARCAEVRLEAHAAIGRDWAAAAKGRDGIGAVIQGAD